MTDSGPLLPTDSGSDIHIVGLNTDKTRKMIGSETVYQVYFELSMSPSNTWRALFEIQWKEQNAGQPLALQDTSIERTFLVIHCPLEDLTSYLPKLQKAVAASNSAYTLYTQMEASERQVRMDKWSEERKRVEEVARALKFSLPPTDP